MLKLKNVGYSNGFINYQHIPVLTAKDRDEGYGSAKPT
jgi:hypothetical protein